MREVVVQVEFSWTTPQNHVEQYKDDNVLYTQATALYSERKLKRNNWVKRKESKYVPSRKCGHVDYQNDDTQIYNKFHTASQILSTIAKRICYKKNMWPITIKIMIDLCARNPKPWSEHAKQCIIITESKLRPMTHIIRRNGLFLYM